MQFCLAYGIVCVAYTLLCNESVLYILVCYHHPIHPGTQPHPYRLIHQNYWIYVRRAVYYQTNTVPDTGLTGCGLVCRLTWAGLVAISNAEYRVLLLLLVLVVLTIANGALLSIEQVTIYAVCCALIRPCFLTLPMTSGPSPFLAETMITTV